MGEKFETYYHCMLCAQLECTTKLIRLQENEDVFHKAIVKLSRLNILYDYDEKFPKNVCESCNNNVDKAFEFVIKVEKAQNILNDYYKNKNDCLKEQVSDNSEYEEGLTLNDEDSSVFKGKDDKPTCTLENIKHEPCDDEQDNISKRQLNNNLHSDISENLYSLGKKLDCGELDFEIYTQYSNSCDVSEEISSCESDCNDKIKKSNERTDRSLTWNDYPWTCSICETQFYAYEELKLHSIQYHQICNALKCHECNKKKLYLNAFIVHVQRHNSYLKCMCYKCNRKFSNTRALNDHTKLAHGPKTKYACRGCNADFKSAEELRVHTDTFLKQRVQQIPVELITKQNSLSCNICKKSFKTKQCVRNHLIVHTDRKKEHICDKCGKCFVNKEQLAGHLVSHKDQRSFECSICKSSFKALRQLKNHIAIHSGEKPFKCEQCGKGFRLKSYLKSHMITHTNSLPYDCSYCDKKFRFKTIRDQHLRQHTGFKPYSCEICSRDFTNWPNYNKHMKRRHDLNMAKKKTTPEGVYPINPSTGEIIKYDTNETPRVQDSESQRKK